ncbi:MAG: polyamine aminopropyltransferase [Bacteroidetes bacterium]|nr:polyamine aminopropyltransferase [Bacteroidota bacterium]
MGRLLLLSALVISTCGLVYELLSATLASYLLGDSITQFSLVIGVYLFSMGVGSFLSRYVQTALLATFIRVELLVGLVGGFSATLLFVLFNVGTGFQGLLFGLLFLTGTLVGLEIPLLMRILKDRYPFSSLVAHVFTFDYIGALLASILFPLLLIPHLGILRTGLLFGLLNTTVALWTIYYFRGQLKGLAGHYAGGALVWLLLLGGFIWAQDIQYAAEASAYADHVVTARTTPYQRIVLTHSNKGYRLFLNGNLQFDSADEYRYHESLVHPAMVSTPQPRRVLILGGGDGFAVREVLRHASVDSITLVELDPEMTRLFGKGQLARLNSESLGSPRLRIVNTDAFHWVRSAAATYDVIIIDFPDPTSFSIAKLYSQHFYQSLHRILRPGGVFVVQSTSPYFAPKAFWCVERTIAAAGFHTLPYHAYVPSFGEWGFVLAGHEPPRPGHLPPNLRFLTASTFVAMCNFPPDMARQPVEVNRLSTQVLVQYFEEEWSRYANP